jgi:hypothetical protein
LIVKIGRELHFEKPYQSARVLTIVDDARKLCPEQPRQV